MTRYEELSKAANKAQTEREENLFECKRFLIGLREGFVEYLQCPDDAFKFADAINLEESNLNEAIHTMDNFFHIGFLLTIPENLERKYPNQTLKYGLKLKKKEEAFIVKLHNDETEFKIHKDNPEKFKEFYEYLFNEIMEIYEEEFKTFFSK
ncbi:hypothetical protein [Methanobacterium congolense]|uniref:PH domain n=1 Tax=Methanobacterium congolense TaxID=118062 RepID=A0A1D3L0S6_9EURY|nr:hypothetical protein [Methanobacterium congolense]SCG85168.1 PH domain [Methanobacterium congolense]